MNSYNPERAKALRDERRRLGMCTECGRRPAFGHYVRCEYCIENGNVRNFARWESDRGLILEQARQRRDRWRSEGRCSACGAELPDRSHKQCPKCRAMSHASYARRYVHRVRPDGVCLRCDRAVEPGFRLCSVHRALCAAAGEKGRRAQDRSRHPWRLDEEIRRGKG